MITSGMIIQNRPTTIAMASAEIVEQRVGAQAGEGGAVVAVRDT